jgi:hypothetical protein
MTLSDKDRLMLAEFFARNEDNAKSRKAWSRVADALRKKEKGTKDE